MLDWLWHFIHFVLFFSLFPVECVEGVSIQEMQKQSNPKLDEVNYLPHHAEETNPLHYTRPNATHVEWKCKCVLESVVCSSNSLQTVCSEQSNRTAKFITSGHTMLTCRCMNFSLYVELLREQYVITITNTSAEIQFECEQFEFASNAHLRANI